MGNICNCNNKLVSLARYTSANSVNAYLWSHSDYIESPAFKRSEKLCARGVDSTTAKQWKHEKWCGRPLGLRFSKETGDLYIADAYYGLLVVGPEGGLATPLATQAAGKPILFANDLDIHRNGSIFFTDTSKRYNRV